MKEHPTATKVVAGVALVAATGGTALALAPEAAAAGALATVGEEAAAVAEVGTSTGARAAGQVITEVPKPLTGVARTIQPDKVPAAFRAAEMGKAAAQRNGPEAMATEFMKAHGAGIGSVLKTAGDVGKTVWDVATIFLGIH